MSRFKKVLVANRGEIACRIIRSCKHLGLDTLAIYSEADAQSLHVTLADEAYCVGGPHARESYLVVERILEVAQTAGADAIHPGYGFLAENSRFAQAVISAGLAWIGPSPRSIENMGDKERAREIAKASGIPVLPGSPRFPVGELAGIEEAADRVGYPLLVKAAAGGGGIGMRRVDGPETLHQVVKTTQSTAEKAFGDGTIYLERFVPRARHIEVQVFGFGDGQAVHMYERDCSIQRRFQKVIEESPAPGVPDLVREEMANAATKLCRYERYLGAGTVEFIVDAGSFEFFFLEMNTRIQVEHPVTEMATRLDLVGMQLDLARGRLNSLKQDDIRHRGHAIECRIYAEDPHKNFMPSPGRLERLHLPAESDGLRIDSGFREGDTVTFFYDPMIAKVICHGPSRAEAIHRMVMALDAVEVSGVKTNVSFLRSCMQNPSYRSGELFTGFIDVHKNEILTAERLEEELLLMG